MEQVTTPNSGSMPAHSKCLCDPLMIVPSLSCACDLNVNANPRDIFSAHFMLFVFLSQQSRNSKGWVIL